jgi:uncharacterized protein YdcH (DUF465 family)
MNLSRLTARDLEDQSRALELQLRKLAHRKRPTPSERQLASELKKMRLAMKDHMLSLSAGRASRTSSESG